MKYLESQIYRDRAWRSGCPGLGGEEMEHILVGLEFQFCKMKTVLEIVCMTVLMYFS